MTKIKLKVLIVATLLLSIVTGDILAQMTTVLANDGGTSGNGRAPSIAFRRIRTHYLITAAELAAAGYTNGSVPGRIGWTYSANSAGGTTPLIIYMENTADVTNLKSATWATAVATMTVVHNNAATVIPGGTATPNINFTGGSPFTYTGGGLYIAFDQGCYTGTTAAVTTLCNFTGLVGGLKGAQSTLACPGTPAVTVVTSNFRPETRLGPPQPANDLAISHIYTEGNIPVGYATNNIIRARIVNEGTNASAATTVDLNITGANSFSSLGIVVPALASGASAVVSFAPYTPTNLGANTITVTLPADDVLSNNTSSMGQISSKDINSYRYLSPVTGGVGFTGGTGDFVAKFNAANNFGDTDTINGFEVIFTSNSQPYNVVVFDDDGIGGVPGTLLHISASQTTIQDTVFISLPDVEVTGGYYVGIRQTGTVNVGFGYQTENPIRTGQFYFGAIGAPTTDFSTASANFRLTATVQYKTPVPPNCAIYLSPANAGSACQNGATLSYGSGGGGPTGYRVYFGTNQALVQAEDPGTLVQNSAATTYATGPLTPGGTYYWRVTAYNAQGDAIGCATSSRSFTAALQPCYCAASSASAAFEHITNVQSGAFSNPSVGSLYTNYFNLGPINNVNIGSTFNITVTQPLTQVYDEDRIFVFGDFNQDGDWTDPGELCGNADITIANGNVTVVTCTVPVGATPGNTALRIKLGDEVSAPLMNNSPCQTGFGFGEVEDYLVNVTCGALATATNPACALAALSLNATYLGAGTPVSYSWTTTAANGFTSSSSNPTVTLFSLASLDDGVYTVTITDNNGCIATANVTVAVNPSPQPQIGGGNPSDEFCEGAAIALTSNNLDNTQTTIAYSWTTTAANAFTSTNQNPTVTNSASANDAGTYTVVMTNSLLCTASASVAIAVNPNPSLALQSTTGVGCSTIPVCDGSAVVLASGGTPPYQLYSDLTSAASNLDGNFNGVMCLGASTITVQDDKGCEGSVAVNIGAISTGPPAGSVVVPPINNLPSFACNGTLVNNINVPAVSGATFYNWDGPTGTDFNGAGSTFSNATPNANITFGPLGVGASGYYIGVQAANGCGTSARKVQWVRGTLSVPVLSGPTVICAGGNANYSVTNAPIVGAQSYTWTGPAGTTFDGNPTPYTTASTTVNAVMSGSFTSGTICVTANAACISSAPKCINVSTAPAALGPMSGVFSVCPPASQTYTVSNPGFNGGTYAWTLPANASGSSTSDNINVSFASGFTGGNISVTYTNACGVTSAPRTKSISIGTPTVPASITGQSNGICGQVVSYSCPPQAGATFTWSSSSGTVTSGQGTNSVQITFGTFTTGTVSVVATNGCGTSGARTISVKGAPNTPGVITANPPVWCDNDPGIQFSSNLSGLTGVYTLSWAVVPAAAANYVSGQGTNLYTVDWNTGSASVNLTASNACGAATRTYAASTGCRETGIAVSAEGFAVEVYPNPASSIINFEFNSSSQSTATVNLMDVSGRSVISQTVNTVEGFNAGSLDLGSIAKGVYTIAITTTDGTSNVKVVVE